MLTEAILHESTRSSIFPLSRTDICVRIRARKGDVQECRLHYWNFQRETAGTEHHERMDCFARDELFDHFEAIIHTQAAARYLRYYFSLVDSRGAVCYVTSGGISRTRPANGWFYFPGANERDVISVPGWLRGAVFYQIFPDSFCNADPANDPPGARPWSDAPTRSSFFGGDLKGVTSKLDYLAELGITALYLNPVFLSRSNHRYDTTNYLRIDPSLGCADDLRELVGECHARGIRVILDGVFNHSGFDFEPFQDLLRHGEASRYRDWFLAERFPLVTDPPNYECCGYFGGMPKLRTAYPPVRDYLIDVARHWIAETGIDGWRLDVADEVEYRFWQELRAVLKGMNPEVCLLGETWRHAQDMLRGDQMDSVMNYPLRELAVDFFARRTIGPSGFDAGLNRLIALYPAVNVATLYNPLDSHDTPRFLHLCSGDAARFKLAVGFQMTFPGVPAIYYGDEVGMTGGNDPECRGPMVWDPERQNREILEWYKRLIAMRRSRASLSHGDFVSILCDDRASVYAFLRRHRGEETYVVLNNSPAGREVAVPVCRREGTRAYRDLLTGSEHQAVPMRGRAGRRLHNRDILALEGSIPIRLSGYSMNVLAAV